MRYLTASFFLVGMLALSGPVLARDMSLPKQTPEELKSVCAKVSGSFSQDTNGYACGTDCHGKPGTSCVVFCKAGENCVAQMLGGKRPKTIADALVPPVRHAR